MSQHSAATTARNEQPLDDSDREHDSEHHERSQQQHENDHADRVPLRLTR
jgi:hypothetical protein